MSTILTGCVSCQKPATKRCTLCKVSYYCSKECQKSNWKFHKTVCEQLKGQDDDSIPKKFITENQTLYDRVLELVRVTENTDKFLVFRKEKGKMIYDVMDEATIRKSITPPEVLEGDFWKTAFTLHKNKEKTHVSVLIPYSDEGGHYHFITV
jgi:hypothetical protein